MAQRTRERLAIAVAVIGALATIATSQAPSAALETSRTIEVEADVPVHVVIRLSRAAIDHADGLRLVVDPADDAITTTATPDDATLPPMSGAVFGVGLGDPRAACPGEGDCDLGVELSADGATSLSLVARLVRSTDTSSFPAGSTIEIVVE